MRVACLAFGALFLSGAAFAADRPVSEGCAACTDVIIGAGQSAYDAYVARAAAYDGAGQRDAAIAELSAAIALAPDSAAAYRIRGALYLKDDEFRDGLADLDRAVALAPTDEDALRTRAFAWDSLGNYPAAIADYTALLGLSGDDSYRYFRGFAHFRHGDDSAALADFDAIRGSDSPTLAAWGYRGRARVEEREGALGAALADYNAALGADPADDRSFAGRCRVGAALGQSADALAGCGGVLRSASAAQ